MVEKFVIKLIYKFFKFKSSWFDTFYFAPSSLKLRRTRKLRRTLPTSLLELRRAGTTNGFPNNNLKELPITVVITSYNNIKYCKKNLESVLGQNYSNFDVIYIDDCSKDGTSEIVQKFLEDYDPQKKVKYILNDTRKKKVENLYSVINSLDDNRIILELDGDDYLNGSQVLSLFNNYYQITGAWVVYGNYKNYPEDLAERLEIEKFFQPVPRFILRLNKIRLYPWVFSGLRSYYAALFKKINKESISSTALGEFFPLCGDAAIFYPILEMAQNKVTSIDEIVLLRNIDSPINDFKSYDKKVRKMVWNEICNKTKYSKVEKLF